MRPSILVTFGLAFAALVAAGIAVASRPAPDLPAGHNRFHIGCTDHNHGPKWHADHGRSLLPVSRFALPDADERPGPRSAPPMRD